MKTFDKEQIEQATNYFFQRIGKNNFEIKNISIQSGILEDNFTCECNIHGDFDLFDFFLKKINGNGKLIVGRK